MGSIIKHAVLEYIARTAERRLPDVEIAVDVQYWKDIVSFTSRRGVDLFADYLRSQNISEIPGAQTKYLLMSLSRDFKKLLQKARPQHFALRELMPTSSGADMEANLALPHLNR